jgi:hypothetical protein
MRSPAFGAWAPGTECLDDATAMGFSPAGQNSGTAFGPNRLIFLMTNPAAASNVARV